MKLRQIVWGVLLISQILIFVSASAKRTRKAKTKFSRRKIGGRGVKTIRVVDINSLCEHHETMFTESGDEVYNPKQDTEKLVCAKGSTCIRVRLYCCSYFKHGWVQFIITIQLTQIAFKSIRIYVIATISKTVQSL